jgi:flagellar basal-body rod protein FlgF
VTGPAGPLYTRNGSFRMSATGQLQTQDGYPVLGSNGAPIQLNPNQPVDVDTRGAISQAGQTVGQLQIFSFKNLGDLSKQGQTYFRYGGADTDIKNASGEIQQGKVETSNVPNAEAAVRLVSVMRQFEMLQKAISIGVDMNKEAIEEVARSGS